MHHPTTHRTTRTTHRSQRPSLSPYVLDDTASDAVGDTSGTVRGRGHSQPMRAHGWEWGRSALSAHPYPGHADCDATALITKKEGGSQ